MVLLLFCCWLVVVLLLPTGTGPVGASLLVLLVSLVLVLNLKLYGPILSEDRKHRAQSQRTTVY